VTVTVAAGAADGVRGELALLAAGGWAEREQAGVVAFDVWARAADADAGPRLAAALAAWGAQVATAPEGDEWRDGLRRHHVPIEIAGRLRVRPPWTAPAPGMLDVVIDPGMAFGTGQHATTRGCLDLLTDRPGGALIDVGCGSGVLAIAARLLGYDPVTAVDNDPLAVEATAANARANGVDLLVALCDADVQELPPAETLVANILATPVAALAERLASPPPEQVVLSGFRPAAAGRVVGAWRSAGYVPRRRIDADDWTAVRMERG
jgi:ribosomal protein L11 methyltransferase